MPLGKLASQKSLVGINLLSSSTLQIQDLGVDQANRRRNSRVLDRGRWILLERWSYRRKFGSAAFRFVYYAYGRIRGGRKESESACVPCHGHWLSLSRLGLFIDQSLTRRSELVDLMSTRIHTYTP